MLEDWVSGCSDKIGAEARASRQEQNAEAAKQQGGQLERQDIFWRENERTGGMPTIMALVFPRHTNKIVIGQGFLGCPFNLAFLCALQR